jgi:hypothetical protein
VGNSGSDGHCGPLIILSDEKPARVPKDLWEQSSKSMFRECSASASRLHGGCYQIGLQALNSCPTDLTIPPVPSLPWVNWGLRLLRSADRGLNPQFFSSLYKAQCMSCSHYYPMHLGDTLGLEACCLWGTNGEGGVASARIPGAQTTKLTAASSGFQYTKKRSFKVKKQHRSRQLTLDLSCLATHRIAT